MNKTKRYRIGVLALILLLVCGLLAGCNPASADSGNAGKDTVEISIVDASSEVEETEAETEAEPEEEDKQGESVETEPETEAEPETEVEPETETENNSGTESVATQQYYFRNAKLLGQHYEKHGIEMGFASEEEYEAAASDVINNPNALHKKEKEDNDEVYYVEETNEFAVLSADGYIRTYFYPSAGIKYYNRQ